MLLVLVRVALVLFGGVPLFSHEVGGIAGLDNRPADGKRGRTDGGTDVSSSTSSRRSSSDSIRAPELYDLDRGCRCTEPVVLTDEADDRRERLSVDRRRVSGDGASSSSLEDYLALGDMSYEMYYLSLQPRPVVRPIPPFNNRLSRCLTLRIGVSRSSFMIPVLVKVEPGRE
jgi:hypothetical protein